MIRQDLCHDCGAMLVMILMIIMLMTMFMIMKTKTCAMIVGQCSFCFTQASRSSFLSARDNDWRKKVKFCYENWLQTLSIFSYWEQTQEITFQNYSKNLNALSCCTICKHWQTLKTVREKNLDKHQTNISTKKPERPLQLCHWQTQPSRHLLRGACHHR